MLTRVGATEARIHFGALMRRAVEGGETILVERDGKPFVVLMSYDEYERLRAMGRRPSWEETLGQILRIGAEAWVREGGPLLPPEEVIRQGREERDRQLDAALGRVSEHREDQDGSPAPLR